jgi:transposase
LPSNTIHNWWKKYKEGKLGKIGQNYRPLTEVEIENARLKKALAIAKMENEILKKLPRTLPGSRCPGTR